MKIYVLGSTAFMHSMVKARDDLKKIGFGGRDEKIIKVFLGGV